MKLVAISDGHEMTTAGKRTPALPMLEGRVIHENEFNKAVALLLEKELNRCGIAVINVSDTDNDSLAERVNRANDSKADVFIAIHYNAYDGVFDDYDPEGLSVHIYPGSAEGLKLAEAIHGNLIKGTVQKDRGIKEDNFFVLRNTKMPAVLTENGFMDNKKEALLMIDTDFQKEVAIEHAKGICEYLGITYKIESIGTPIIGTATGTIEQAQEWARNKGAKELLIELAPKFWELAEKVGINPVGLFAQSAKETGYMKFGGVIDASYHNTCGLKNTSGGGNYDPDAHKMFDSWDDGIQAHIDHLALYAGAYGYPKSNTLDPRHFTFINGTADTWEALSGKWAPSESYGSSIVGMMHEIHNIVIGEASVIEEMPLTEVDSLKKELEAMTIRAMNAEGIIKKIQMLAQL